MASRRLPALVAAIALALVCATPVHAITVVGSGHTAVTPYRFGAFDVYASGVDSNAHGHLTFREAAPGGKWRRYDAKVTCVQNVTYFLRTRVNITAVYN